VERHLEERQLVERQPRGPQQLVERQLVERQLVEFGLFQLARLPPKQVIIMEPAAFLEIWSRLIYIWPLLESLNWGCQLG
jgi:hypothetical protein